MNFNDSILTSGRIESSASVASRCDTFCAVNEERFMSRLTLLLIPVILVFSESAAALLVTSGGQIGGLGGAGTVICPGSSPGPMASCNGDVTQFFFGTTTRQSASNSADAAGGSLTIQARTDFAGFSPGLAFSNVRVDEVFDVVFSPGIASGIITASLIVDGIFDVPVGFTNTNLNATVILNGNQVGVPLHVQNPSTPFTVEATLDAASLGSVGNAFSASWLLGGGLFFVAGSFDITGRITIEATDGISVIPRNAAFLSENLSVPEPTSAALFAFGALLTLRRRGAI